MGWEICIRESAGDALTGEVQRQRTNCQAIIMYLIFVVLTLYITY
ncbi:hypothetical protein ACVGV8_01030, partial [Enterobacter intestinihominis]